MEKLVQAINEIIKYGLNPKVQIKNKEQDLERHLVKLYQLSFEIEYNFDERKFQDFNKSTLPNIRENVAKNFPEFRWYHTILNSPEIMQKAKLATGDAIDDLADIIQDLIEIKWRFENNSEANGWWFFEFIFKAHSKNHLIDLLHYLKNKS